MKINKLFTTLFVCVLLVATLLLPIQVSGKESKALNTNSNVSVPNRGSYFDAIISAVMQSGAIQNELMAKGLVNINIDKQGKATGGRADVNAIEKMIDSGVYWVDQQQNLRADTKVESEVFSTLAVDDHYRHAGIVTATYSYWGNSFYAIIPPSINLGANTYHNLYSSHLCQGDLDHWIEAGIIWSQAFIAGPALFTYDSYGTGYQWVYVPGGVQREVYIQVEVFSDYTAEMYASDSYSGLSIYVMVSQVDSLNSRADENQEQYSSSYTYTPTEKVKLNISKLKNTSGNWINWGSGIPYGYMQAAPLYCETGVSWLNRWAKTWCAP